MTSALRDGAARRDNEGVTSSNSDLRSLTAEKKLGCSSSVKGRGGVPNVWRAPLVESHSLVPNFPRASGEEAEEARRAGEFIWISDKPRMRLG